MSLRTIFETCRPRADVEAGTTKDEQFAADLAQVVNRTAPKEYADPAVFFRHSYPTRGMRELLKAVLTRLSGRGGEIGVHHSACDTQYGGGKTHSLIASCTRSGGWKGSPGSRNSLTPPCYPEVRSAWPPWMARIATPPTA